MPSYKAAMAWLKGKSSPKSDARTTASEDSASEKHGQSEKGNESELKYESKDVEAQADSLRAPPQNDLRLKQLDTGDVKYAKWRQKWWQIWCVHGHF